MELKVKEEGKKELSIEITEANDTLIYPVVSMLLQDKDVLEARYFRGHPLLDKPVLYVKTKRVKPQTAIRRVSEKLSKEYGEAKRTLSKAAK
jgi:DNA-directed RNA polymerase subunit L